MRRSIWLCVLGVCAGLTLSAQAATYGGGSGTVADPYQIWTAEQMNTIGANSGDWNKSFKLMADIDMSAYTGSQYNIIGNGYTAFTGTFDGHGHSIHNLTCITMDPISPMGLFVYTDGAVISNLNLKNITIYLSQTACVGGLVGWQSGGTITNCSVTGIISGGSSDFVHSYVGGLVGIQEGGSITNCYSMGAVISLAYENAYAGGLVGQQSNGGTITNCYSTGAAHAAVTSTVYYSCAGGLVGMCYGSITSSYAVESVRGNYKGGLVGTNSGSVTNCFWDTTVSGITSGAGDGTAISTGGMTTAQMQTLSTFTGAGWDFLSTDGDAADWIMPAYGYPFPAWRGCNHYSFGDINQDCHVDMTDFVILAADWLECTAADCE
jgi:hypothetical protein